ncbi:hypothetical protein D8B23_20455 [Verminephrobacter aporrectodeae subsp. tuberculatae]|nr:hypothetical protein [Verminephrobacter aporrectodeae subsp. tuberculatae]
MNMLFDSIYSFGTTTTHRANRVPCTYFFPDLYNPCVVMEDLVTVSICVTNLDGAVLAAHKSHDSANGRTNHRMCQIDSRLSTLIIKINSSMWFLALSFFTVAPGDMWCFAILFSQYYFHYIFKRHDFLLSVQSDRFSIRTKFQQEFRTKK